jgi:hypothetical protein
MDSSMRNSHFSGFGGTPGAAIRIVKSPRPVKWAMLSLFALESFQERERHCRGPRWHIEGGLNLGSWVSTQRSRQDALSPERRQRLEEIGFIWNARLASPPA